MLAMSWFLKKKTKKQKTKKLENQYEAVVTEQAEVLEPDRTRSES